MYNARIEKNIDEEDKKNSMAQVSVIVPEDIYALLAELAEETGRSTSSLCSQYIREGIYKEIDNLNKVGAWRDMVAKRKQFENTPQKQK